MDAVLPARRQTLRVVATDASGSSASARVRVTVARGALRIVSMTYDREVATGTREVSVRGRATERATLTVGSRTYAGVRTARLRVPLPASPRSGDVRLKAVLKAASGRTVKGVLLVRRGGR